MPTEMIPFPEFVRRLTDAGAHDLEDWQLAIVRDWTRPETRNVLYSMPRHHGRNQIGRYLNDARRAYERAYDSNANHILVLVDPADPESHVTIRVREPTPEAHRDHTHIQMATSRRPSTDWQDAIMSAWASAVRAGRPDQVPDEITDADRQRWANEAETTPYQGDDSGGALSSDELRDMIPDIETAVDEWKDERDA